MSYQAQRRCNHCGEDFHEGACLRIRRDFGTSETESNKSERPVRRDCVAVRRGQSAGEGLVTNPGEISRLNENSESDPFESEEYQKFVESMIPHCRCRGSDVPCGGVLAGGLCDEINDDADRWEHEDEDLF